MVELAQRIVGFPEFFDDTVLLLNLLKIPLFFFFEVVVGIIQNLNHFFDLKLIALDIEERLINVLLFPFKQLLVFHGLLRNGLFKKVDLFRVATVEVVEGLAELSLVLLQLFDPFF